MTSTPSTPTDSLNPFETRELPFSLKKPSGSAVSVLSVKEVPLSYYEIVFGISSGEPLVFKQKGEDAVWEAALSQCDIRNDESDEAQRLVSSLESACYLWVFRTSWTFSTFLITGTTNFEVEWKLFYTNKFKNLYVSNPTGRKYFMVCLYRICTSKHWNVSPSLICKIAQGQSYLMANNI